MDPDWQNIAAIRLTDVRDIPLAPVSRPGIGQRRFRSVGLEVKYVVWWRRATTDRNGSGVRYISIVQEQPGLPWRIDSIGSAP